MCRLASTDLARSSSAVAEARAFVVQALRRWDLDDLRPDAELLTSELVTNAVLHASSDVTVTLAVAEGTAEIGVTDASADPPRPRAAGSSAEGGRGMRLVGRLAQEWGVADLAGGKQVWVRLAVGAAWANRSACPCGSEDLRRVRLESGRWAAAAPGPWDWAS